MIFKKITEKFLIVALAILTLNAFAQAQTPNADKVVAANGEYSFKQSDINRLIEIYEWMLAGEFTESQRSRFQTLIVKDAQASREAAQGVQRLLDNYEKIKADDGQKRATFQLEILPKLVEAMEKEGGATNHVLLEVYRGGQNKKADGGSVDLQTADKNADKPPNAGGNLKISDLAGIWTTASGSTERYKSLISGELSDPSGYVIEYQFLPNGQIKYASYSSYTTYGCTGRLFVYKSGRARVEGSNLTIDYAPGKRTSQFCAAAEREATIPAARQTLPFRIERNEHGLKLCTVQEGSDFCLRKVKQ